MKKTEDPVMLDFDELDTNQVLDGGEQELNDEVQKMLNSWNRDEMLKEVAESKSILESHEKCNDLDLYDGSTDFETIKKSMVGYNNDGVFVEILDEKPGARQICATDSIICDYFGFLEYEQEAFESTMNDGKPKMSNLWEDSLIPGFISGLLQMREGERAKILIHPRMAYGQNGALPIIPGDSYILYFVKIHKSYQGSALKTMDDFERNVKTELTVEEKLEMITDHKNIANRYLRDGMTREALIRYRAGISYIKSLPNAFQFNKEVNAMLGNLSTNAAIACNNLGMHRAATKMAKGAIFCSSTNLKAYYQLVKARIFLNDYDSALKYIEDACRLFPETKCFDRMQIDLDMKMKDEKKKRDEIMKRMSKSFQ